MDDDLAKELIKQAETEPDLMDQSYAVQRYSLVLGDTVTTCDGGASVEVADGQYGQVFQFDVTLGPVNARRLIAFLRSLPVEPGHD